MDRNASHSSGARFVPIQRLIVLIDLAGYSKAYQSHTDEEMADLVQAYYAECETVVTAKGGTVVKFMGDGCLSVFPLEGAINAVAAVIELQPRIRAIAEDKHVNIELGANLHAGTIIEGEFGAGRSLRKDIVGRAVNQTFLLGRGAGIRISEPVYRALPSGARSAWQKHKPPAVYNLKPRKAPGSASSEGIYEGMGKDPATNIDRW